MKSVDRHKANLSFNYEKTLIFFTLWNLHTRVREPTLQRIVHEVFFLLFCFYLFKFSSLSRVDDSNHPQRFPWQIWVFLKESNLSSAGQWGRWEGNYRQWRVSVCGRHIPCFTLLPHLFRLFFYKVFHIQLSSQLRTVLIRETTYYIVKK